MATGLTLLCNRLQNWSSLCNPAVDSVPMSALLCYSQCDWLWTSEFDVHLEHTSTLTNAKTKQSAFTGFNTYSPHDPHCCGTPPPQTSPWCPFSATSCVSQTCTGGGSDPKRVSLCEWSGCAVTSPTGTGGAGYQTLRRHTCCKKAIVAHQQLAKARMKVFVLSTSKKGTANRHTASWNFQPRLAYFKNFESNYICCLLLSKITNSNKIKPRHNIVLLFKVQ